jgi:hypothetical protein
MEACKSSQLALSSPKNPHLTIHAHVTFFKTNTMLFLATSATGESGALAQMGSFVYAMPMVVFLTFTMSTYPYLINGFSEVKLELSKAPCFTQQNTPSIRQPGLQRSWPVA